MYSINFVQIWNEFEKCRLYGVIFSCNSFDECEASSEGRVCAGGDDVCI